MIRLFLFLLLITVPYSNSAAIAGDRSKPPKASTYRFKNGRWFDGQRFEDRTLYSVGGVFSAKEPIKIDKTVDLQGSYVLPPFGDAHNHTLEFSFNVKTFSNQLLTEGIFYLKNPNSVPRFTNQIREYIGKPDTIDAVFANGGLTANGGHPSILYDQVLANGPFKNLNITNYNGLAYHLINDKKDLKAKWSAIRADKPDFIKVYVLFSEEYKQRRDKDVKGSKGLNPKLLPKIVKKAHKAGLRVSAHVNTAFDFGVAVRAGVDEINHLPGRFSYSASDFERYVIKESDAKLAGKKRVVVVPTYSLFLNNKNSKKTQLDRAQEVQRSNLRLLRKYGVRIALGPDSYFATSQREAFYLRDLGVFSNLELIKMWAENTPLTIFPERKITKLKAGYEASLIAMPKNPLNDLNAVKNITYRFKQGYQLDLEKPDKSGR